MSRCLLVVAYHYPPDGAIGGARPARFVRYLPEVGWTPIVCTAAAAESSVGLQVIGVPDRSRAIWEGANDIVSPVSRWQRTRELFLRRFLYPGAFGLTWRSEVAQATLHAVSGQQLAPTVVFSSFPPLASSFAGHRIARRLGIPWVADLRDPVAFGMAGSGSWLARKCKQRAEMEVFRDADAVIINTEAMADAYAERFPQWRHKMHVIWNGFDPADSLVACPIPERSVRVLSHVGSLYSGRNPLQILASVQRLRETASANAPKLRIDLVGPTIVDAACQELIRHGIAEGWVNHRAGSIPKEEALRVSAESDFLFLVQPQSSLQVPGKLFEYIQFGRPILSLAPKDSAIEWILVRAGVPYVNVYPDDSAQETDQKVARFLELESEPVPASTWFQQTFNAERQTAQLAEILNRVVASKGQKQA
jgi:glycosyltransferase involved in cell wall biosynthesis